MVTTNKVIVHLREDIKVENSKSYFEIKPI